MTKIYKNPYFIFLFVASVFVLFFNSFEGTFFNSDDYIYAEIVKQMRLRGDWLNLYWQDYSYLTKPPLYFWCGSLFSLIFGLNEFALRLPALIFGLATVILVFLHTRKISNDRSALIAAFTLLGFQLFLNLSRRAMLDVPLVFFISFSIIAFTYSLEKGKWFYAAWISAGFAFLTKGYMFFPAVLIPFFYFVYKGALRRYLSRDSIKAFVIMLFLVLPWQLYNLLSRPDFFIKRFFSDQLLKHYLGSGASYFKKPLYFYMQRFIQLDPLISILIALALIVFIFNLIFYISRKEKFSFSKYFTFVVWILSCLLIYSFSSSKLEHYIIVIYPAIGIFVGLTFHDLNLKIRDIVGWLIIVFLILINVLNFMPYFNKQAGFFDSSGQIKRLVVEYNEISTKNDTLYLYGVYLPAPVFYSNTKVVSIEANLKRYEIMKNIPEFTTQGSLIRVNAEEFKHFIETKQKFYCLINKKYWGDITEISGKLVKVGIENNYILFSYSGASKLDLK